MAKFDDGRLLLAGCRPWDRGRMEAYQDEHGVCPICHGADLPFIAWCLYCGRAGLDRLVQIGRAKFHGEPVGALIRDQWKTPQEKAESEGKPVPTVYEPSGLRGGKG